MAKRHFFVYLRDFSALSILLLGLAACQSTTYLMPTPEALTSGVRDPFSIDPTKDQTNRLTVPYATNRLPIGPESQRTYLTLFDQDLRLGFSQVRLGDEGVDWDELHRISRTSERSVSIPLVLETATELAVVERGDPPLLPARAEAFFAAINEDLAQSLDKDLTIYVHGANSNFYRANAHAAQYRHFTGRNSVVLTYAWPSAESLLRYAVDVNNARRSVPVFARLLELLAAHTDARRIDILAYSAGAQILSPALTALSAKYANERRSRLKRRLRLGEVYFAAPDVDFKQFIADLAGYVGIPDHVTVAVNPNDSVLAMAADHHGVSRAGRPDPEELTAEETRWLRKASRDRPRDLIWSTSDEIPGRGRGSHSFWYSHPWVSTDVLIQLLFNARPAERGLGVYEEEGTVRVWYFPPDYPQQASEAIDRLKLQHPLSLPQP